MNADALLKVTRALRQRLEQVAGIGKVFVGPLDDQDAAGASLILFLYRVMPNPSLRNREHRVPADVPPPSVIVFGNSLPLDLHYLVTVGTTPGDDEESLLEVLGGAMQSLQLDPDLTGPVVGHETVHLSLDPLTTEETSRIWALFPTANYRTSIAYIASPVWIDPKVPATLGAPVVKDSLDVGVRVTFDEV
jgi:hypothetical protein